MRKKHITDIISWIECNFSNELDIEHIALISGYSKWHLQRMFKDVTGHTLAFYIRNRRLTLSALALIFTNDSILDIAFSYGFNTQQNLTRLLKTHFSTTPARIRREKNLDIKLLFPKFSFERKKVSGRIIHFMKNGHVKKYNFKEFSEEKKLTSLSFCQNSASDITSNDYLFNFYLEIKGDGSVKNNFISKIERSLENIKTLKYGDLYYEFPWEGCPCVNMLDINLNNCISLICMDIYPNIDCVMFKVDFFSKKENYLSGRFLTSVAFPYNPTTCQSL